MSYLYSIALILGISWIGDLLHQLLPLPVPGSIYGLIILLLLLLSGAVKLEKVRATGDFLVGLMPLMFIAPSVGLMDSFDSCKNFLVPMIVICVVSTPVVMAATGLVSQRLMRSAERRKRHE